MTRFPAAAAAAFVTLLAASAQAQPLTFTAMLTNAAENPPVTPTLVSGAPRPASFGTATFTLNAERTALSWTATIFNIDVTGTQSTDVNDNLVAAHIHAGPNTTPTTNAGVVWGFFGTPFNNNNPNDGVFTPFATGVGGSFAGTWNAPEGNNTTLAAQIDNIIAGRAYMNFHTVQFGGGEIRGALVVTPEPGTWALLATGLVGIGAVAIRRRRAT